MLIIARRKGERICVGKDVEIVVTEITRKGVRLGIAAPTTTLILRGEVKDEVERTNRAAASADIVLPGEPNPSSSAATGVRSMAGIAIDTNRRAEAAEPAAVPGTPPPSERAGR
jgi:carbon storage regulator